MEEFECVCGEKFNLVEGANIIPDHYLKHQQLCPGSGKKVKISYEEDPRDCPPGYTAPGDCGNCGRPLCPVSGVIVHEK